MLLHLCVHAQWCLTLCDPMDCNPLGSSVCGISQATMLEWASISSSRGSLDPGIEPASSWISYAGRQILYHWANWNLSKACRSLTSQRSITYHFLLDIHLQFTRNLQSILSCHSVHHILLKHFLHIRSVVCLFITIGISFPIMFCVQSYFCLLGETRDYI